MNTNAEPGTSNPEQPSAIAALAHELSDGYAHARTIATPPSMRDGGLDLSTAYAVERELMQMRRGEGRATVGLKVGYANKAVWRALKLETLVWAHMYDDTVRYAEDNETTLSVEHMCSPKIEPEIVFRLKRPLLPDTVEAEAILDAVEWLALGFEIIDCVYDGWRFQPADFVAAFGLHAALVVGEPLIVKPQEIPDLTDRLARFSVRLLKNGTPVAEGSGRNSLRSPALCVGELAAAIARQPGAEPLAAGDLVSSGTLTESQPIAAGEAWSAVVEGLALPPLGLYLHD